MAFCFSLIYFPFQKEFEFYLYKLRVYNIQMLILTSSQYYYYYYPALSFNFSLNTKKIYKKNCSGIFYEEKCHKFDL